ncbi:MAG: hypothetical protein M3R24_28540 [Chloroflexota bacterium]|nr:hypothetical protein [Chloroflexota bacterium]
MSLLQVLHTGFGRTTLLFMLALGLWGLWNFVRGEGVTGSYWGALAIGEGLVVVESLIGVGLYLAGSPGPARGLLHVLYGIVAVICLPAAFSFTRGRASRYEALIYAVIALFLAGIANRAQTTGM